MTLDGLRQQFKTKKLPTSGNKKTLAPRLSAHLDQSGTSNRSKQTDTNPRLREARQRERRKTDHKRHISPSLEPRTTAHKKPRQRRSTAAARQREQDYGSGEPSRCRRRHQTESRCGSPSVSSRSRSRSPISTRRPSEGTNRAVPTATVVWSEKELPEASNITHGEDTCRPHQRGTSSMQPEEETPQAPPTLQQQLEYNKHRQ